MAWSFAANIPITVLEYTLIPSLLLLMMRRLCTRTGNNSWTGRTAGSTVSGTMAAEAAAKDAVSTASTDKERAAMEKKLAEATSTRASVEKAREDQGKGGELGWASIVRLDAEFVEQSFGVRVLLSNVKFCSTLSMLLLLSLSLCLGRVGVCSIRRFSSSRAFTLGCIPGGCRCCHWRWCGCCCCCCCSCVW